MSQALVAAAVVIPAAALNWKEHGQIIMNEDAFKAALAEEDFNYYHSRGMDEAENEWDLFEEQHEEQDDNEWHGNWNNLFEDEDDFDSVEWTFPKSPPNWKDLKGKIPWDGSEHDGFPGGRPRRPERPGRPGRPGEEPGHPGRHHPPHRKPGHPSKPGDRPHCTPGCGGRPSWRFPHPPFHHPPPFHGRPGSPPQKRFPCHSHFRPIHTNKTIYELLSESKYTTKAFEIIKKDEELSEFFKNTKSNITLFVPTDKAFENLPPHHPPHNATDAQSKEFLRKAVLYHTSPDAYDTRKLFFSKTIASGIDFEDEVAKGVHQRLRVSHHPFFGMRVNMLSKLVAGNIYATNGIIHGIDHLIVPPTFAQRLVGILPTAFSTSALALAKMELAGEPKLPEGPKTFFIPPNSAWKGLGYRINAFLFSHYGEKYLAALMKYHITHGKVVYSDYVIEPKNDGNKAKSNGEEAHFHTELDTFLGDKKLTIDIWRKGPWTRWKINEKIPAMLTDVITRDGVLHVPYRVLIPPHPGKPATPKPDDPLRILDEDYTEGMDAEEDEELTMENLKARLEPYL